MSRSENPLAAVMPHPPELGADLVGPGLHARALVGGQSLALPVHSADPLPDSVQLAIGAERFAPVEPAVGNATVDPVLQELNTLVGILRRALPDCVSVPCLPVPRR